MSSAPRMIFGQRYGKTTGKKHAMQCNYYIFNKLVQYKGLCSFRFLYETNDWVHSEKKYAM